MRALIGAPLSAKLLRGERHSTVACSSSVRCRLPVGSAHGPRICEQVRGVQCVWPGHKPGDVVGGPGGKQHRHAAEECGLLYARYMRTLAATGTPLPARLAAGRSAPGHSIPRLHAPQVVETWCVLDESEAWGEAGMPQIDLFTQYYASMAAVLVWLTTARDTLPPHVLAEESKHVRGRDCKSNLHAAARVRTSHVSLPADLALSVSLKSLLGLLQHIQYAALLYEGLCVAGKEPHAIYLEAFCSAAGGSLLVAVMEEALFASGGAQHDAGEWQHDPCLALLRAHVLGC